MPTNITAKLESGKSASEVIARTATGKVILLRDAKGALPGHHAEIEITQERERVCFGRVVRHAKSLFNLKHGDDESLDRRWLDAIATMDHRGASIVEVYLPGKEHNSSFRAHTYLSRGKVHHVSASNVFLGKMLERFPTWGKDFEGFTPNADFISTPWGTDYLNASEVEDFILDTPVKVERRNIQGPNSFQHESTTQTGEWTIKMVHQGRVVSTQHECHPSGWYERYTFKSGESVFVPSFTFIGGQWHWKDGFVPTLPTEPASWIATQDEISAQLKIAGIAAIPMLYSKGKAVPTKAFWLAAYEAGLVSVEGVGARVLLRCGKYKITAAYTSPISGTFRALSGPWDAEVDARLQQHTPACTIHPLTILRLAMALTCDPTSSVKVTSCGISEGYTGKSEGYTLSHVFVGPVRLGMAECDTPHKSGVAWAKDYLRKHKEQMTLQDIEDMNLDTACLARGGNLDAGPFWAEVEALAWIQIQQSILASPDRHRLTTLPLYAGYPLFEGAGYPADLEWYKDKREEARSKPSRYAATPSLPTWNIPWSQSHLHNMPCWDAVVDIIARSSHLRMHSTASQA